jgi:preprotein translocase subunit SecF
MKPTIKFIEKRNLWYLISFTIIFIGFTLIGLRAINSKPALNYGIDFVGGNTFLLQLQYTKININDTQIISKIRTVLDKYDLEKSEIQLSENNQLYIKTTSIDKSISSSLLADLTTTLGNFEILEIDYIGPSIGNSLKKQSIWIILVVSASLLLYITLRFELSFGISALLALLHDTLIMISAAAIFSFEINTAFIAALLTILGYSINDTIVIFDRIREQLNKNDSKTTLIELTNSSLTQTLSRTLSTSITTLLVIISLILFSDGSIKEFCILLFIGIVAGTYSSIFIASPIFVALHKEKPREE